MSKKQDTINSLIEQYSKYTEAELNQVVDELFTHLYCMTIAGNTDSFEMWPMSETHANDLNLKFTVKQIPTTYKVH